MQRPTPTSFDGAVLRRMRRKAGLSLEALALASGMYDKGQLSRIERGQVVPLATTLGRVLQVLRPEAPLLYALFGISSIPEPGVSERPTQSTGRSGDEENGSTNR